MRAPVRTRALSQEEYHALKRMARSRTLCAGRVQRARIISLSNQGYLSHEIAVQLGVHEKTVRRWVGRFNKYGLPGLEEGPRHGRPPITSPHHGGEVIATALTPPDTLGLPCGSWTLERLVAYLTDLKGIPMKRSRMREIFRHEGLRWRQQEGWFGERVDPAFAQKRGQSSSSTPPLQTVAS